MFCFYFSNNSFRVFFGKGFGNSFDNDSGNFLSNFFGNVSAIHSAFYRIVAGILFFFNIFGNSFQNSSCNSFMNPSHNFHEDSLDNFFYICLVIIISGIPAADYFGILGNSDVTSMENFFQYFISNCFGSLSGKDFFDCWFGNIFSISWKLWAFLRLVSFGNFFEFVLVSSLRTVSGIPSEFSGKFLGQFLLS